MAADASSAANDPQAFVTQAAGLAQEAIAPEVDLMPGLDPVSFGEALAQLGAGLARRPASVLGIAGRWAVQQATTGAIAAARALGAASGGLASPPPRDRRFADPAWEQNPAFFALLQ